MDTWQQEFLAWCRHQLAIPDIWEINLQYNDNILGERGADASVDIKVLLLRATIYLKTTIQPDLDGYESIAHEAIHIATNDVDESVRRAHEILPEGARETLERVYHDALEQFVTATARRMAATYNAPMEKDDEANRSDCPM